MKTPDKPTDRREFLQRSLLGTTGAGIAIASTGHVTAASVSNAAEPEITNDVDVLVVGGGTAGTIAAIQAGRAGAKTLLEVPIAEIHQLLREHNAIIPGDA